MLIGGPGWLAGCVSRVLLERAGWLNCNCQSVLLVERVLLLRQRVRVGLRVRFFHSLMQAAPQARPQVLTTIGKSSQQSTSPHTDRKVRGPLSPSCLPCPGACRRGCPSIIAPVTGEELRLSLLLSMKNITGGKREGGKE